MDDVERVRAKAALLARLDELTQRMTHVVADLAEAVPQDWHEQATAREGDEVLEGLGAEARHEAAMIRAGLARLGTGDYGLCARCGAAIDPSRLAALPWAPLCLPCAKAVSHHGA